MSVQVSIVTPNLNRGGMLADALASVATQTGVAFEHIFVDGGSTDNSVALAASSGARVIEAPGSSIYEAINIGIAAAQGEFICLLNSDDWLRPGALKAALAAFETEPNLDLVRGRADVEASVDGHWVMEPALAEPAAPSLANALLGRSNINACIFKRTLFERVGPFNPTYAISADREWLARVLLSDARTAGINSDIYVYRSHAGSLTIGRERKQTEKWVREHLTFSRALLRIPALTAGHRTVLQQFHAKETAHFALLSLRRFGFGDFVSTTARSFGASPLWPMHAVAPIGAIVARRLRS
ncbi:MAG: glycosyltransferase [Hyphomonadaceae bacterium]|nr:glycosyltransferase [Hyphomonadaceae bacterium]